MDIAVFASGSGSNLQAIIDSCESGNIAKGKVSVVVSDRKKAYALERARNHGIRTLYVPRKKLSREEHEEKILKDLGDVDLVVLAGYMRIVSPHFLDNFYDDSLKTNRVMNIHPSLLPAFKGSMDAYKDAIEYGVKVTGVTVHFATADVDGGPIILQEAIPIYSHYNVEDLKKFGLEVEHRIYPKAIDLLGRGRLEVSGKYVKINGM
jgi:phosphoribosylglycinamide formyltransferase-1